MPFTILDIRPFWYTVIMMFVCYYIGQFAGFSQEAVSWGWLILSLVHYIRFTLKEEDALRALNGEDD